MLADGDIVSGFQVNASHDRVSFRITVVSGRGMICATSTAGPADKTVESDCPMSFLSTKRFEYVNRNA